MMDRISSVDDILGTFWKVGHQNEAAYNGASYVRGGDPWMMQEISRVCGAHEQEGSMMNRSASEFSFEQFLKEHVSALQPKPNTKLSSLPESEGCEKRRDGTESENVAGDQDVMGKDPINEDEKEKCGHGYSKHDAFSSLNCAEALEQLQVSQALNPLFTGLPYETVLNHTNPQAYENFLKQRLDLACAAVALSRSQGRFFGMRSSNHATENLEAEQSSYGPRDNTGASKALSFSAPVGIPSLPAKPISEGACSMTTRTTSGSSREQSDNECETEQSVSEQSMNPDEIKRMRRMLSNRESARRSRQRKQAHLTDMEMQVAQLRVENCSLLKRLVDITQKFNEAAVDNRVLKSDVEALRAKVKMAEDIVARMPASMAVAGASRTRCNDTNAFLGLRSSVNVESLSGSHNDHSSASKADTSLFIQGVHGLTSPTSPVNLGKESGNVQQHVVGAKMRRTCSMQRVASLEHLHKRSRGGTACGSIWNGGSWDMESPSIIEHGSVGEC